MLVYAASGELEPYKNPTGVRNRIHRRNMRFLDAYNNAYESYLRGYINKVENANSLKQLKRLGPPSEPYRFPTPRGAHRREILEIARKQNASSFKAWRAIAERIAQIRKIHPPGTFWIEFKFVHEETIRESEGITYKVQIETNLGIDQNGNLITGGSSKLVLQAEGSVRKGNLKGALQREIDNQGNVKTVAKIELERAGVKYGFEMADDGTMKVSYNVVGVETNPNTGLISYSGEIEIPGTGNKVSVSLKFQGITDDVILAFITRAPGFFDAPDPQELICTEWNDLSLQQKRKLEVLGWNERRWNNRFNRRRWPRIIRRGWDQLTPSQKIAAIHLRFDRNYWSNWGSMLNRNNCR